MLLSPAQIMHPASCISFCLCRCPLAHLRTFPDILAPEQAQQLERVLVTYAQLDPEVGPAGCDVWLQSSQLGVSYGDRSHSSLEAETLAPKTVCFSLPGCCTFPVS